MKIQDSTSTAGSGYPGLEDVQHSEYSAASSCPRLWKGEGVRCGRLQRFSLPRESSGEEGLENFDDLFTSMKLKILRVKHFSRTNKIRAK